MNLFDGKSFAKNKENELKLKVKKLANAPKLVSILVGADPASLLYTSLKKKSAEKIGAKFIIKKFPQEVEAQEIIEFIKENNEDSKINGIMVQLPLPQSLKLKQLKILNSIDKKKDVDGLRTSSPYTPAVVKAVQEILEFAVKDLPYFGKRAAVVGAKGNVGKKIVAFLEDKNYKVCECDKDTRDLYAKLTNADLVISATGVPGLIKGAVIKEGAITIDVGAPVGDFEKSVYDRASFATPVPGGVGPVTISCLLENLVESVK